MDSAQATTGSADGARWLQTFRLPPTGLHGANGLCVGTDRRLHVVGAFSNKVTVVDPADGSLSVPPATDNTLRGPDDLVFHPNGRTYYTEPFPGSVTTCDADGKLEIINDKLPAANGIAIHDGRIFITECRPGGSLHELSESGTVIRTLAKNLPMPNALSMGPDKQLYFPAMHANAIMRIDPDAGTPPETFVDGIAIPSAVKFDSAGRILTTELAAGRVLSVDPTNRKVEQRAALPCGLDNVVELDGILYVTNFLQSALYNASSGEAVVRPGLSGPYGMTSLADGSLIVSDGFQLMRLQDGNVAPLADWTIPGFPSFVRTLVADDRAGVLYGCDAAGSVFVFDLASQTFRSLYEGMGEAMGLVLAGSSVIVADAAAGEVLSIDTKTGDATKLASGLSRPTDVAMFGGDVIVCDEAAERVFSIGGALPGDLRVSSPHALAVIDDAVLVLSNSEKSLYAFNAPDFRPTEPIARSLPVKSSSESQMLPGNVVVPGYLTSFADLCALPGGVLLVSGNDSGSILELSKPAR